MAEAKTWAPGAGTALCGVVLHPAAHTRSPAMHNAAFMGEDEIVQFLADQGAEVDVEDKSGQTPWTMAQGWSPFPVSPEEAGMVRTRPLANAATLAERLEELRRVAAGVPPDDDLAGRQEARRGPADAMGGGGVELVGNHTADVVGLEERHRGSLRPPPARAMSRSRRPT